MTRKPAVIDSGKLLRKKIRYVKANRHKIDWNVFPESIRKTFQRLSDAELLDLAESPSPYNKGTWERLATYRVRHVFDVSFDDIGGFSMFHPCDNNDSSLGTDIDLWVSSGDCAK